jgi:MmyB-like transcription regulator ligand binding domain
MVGTPAFVLNGRLDLLAANDLGLALFSPIYADPVRPPNNARFIFLDPYATEFFRDWDKVANVKRFHHPVVGDVELAFESFPLAADPSQSLLTYTAEPGSPSKDALRLLASWAATTDGFEQPASTDDSGQAESFKTPD